MTQQYATQEQVDAFKATLRHYNLYTGHFDRLWKILMIHETDVRTPGDGTRMTWETAVRTMSWIDRQVARLMEEDGNKLNLHPESTDGEYPVSNYCDYDAEGRQHHTSCHQPKCECHCHGRYYPASSQTTRVHSHQYDDEPPVQYDKNGNMYAYMCHACEAETGDPYYWTRQDRRSA